MSRLLPAFLIAALSVSPFLDQQDPAQADPVVSDPVERDSKYPPALVELRIPSGGTFLNGLLYLAQGPGPHPTVVFLHGYPGNERNLDLAQALRRAGFNTLYFNYRGAWGSGGSFSWQNAISDAQAAVAWIRSANSSALYRSDPSRIFLLGHSLGAWVALQAAAREPKIERVIALSPWNVGEFGSLIKGGGGAAEAAEALGSYFDPDAGPLRGIAPKELVADLAAHAKAYDLRSLGAQLSGKSVLLLINSSEDETQSSNQTGALSKAYLEAGARVDRHEVDDDHSMSAHRIWLARQLVKWLQGD